MLELKQSVNKFLKESLNMQNEIKSALKQTSINFLALQEKSDVIEKIAKLWIETLKNGNKIIFCGNGGSAADSQHISAELMGKYKIDRNPMPAINLTTNIPSITAIGNDYGYEYVFSRPLQGVGNKGDLLVGISTSGNSKNILKAFEVAKEMGIKTIAFTGKSGGELIKEADITLNVPSDVTNYIQEMHIASGHIICGIVEKYFWG